MEKSFELWRTITAKQRNAGGGENLAVREIAPAVTA